MSTTKPLGAQAKMHNALAKILQENSKTRANGNVASERTATAYGEVLRKCFNDLHELGYRLENPRNLNGAHLEGLCKKWYADGKKPATMQDYLSKLRVFSKWIGKDDLVKPIWEYLPDAPRTELKVSRIARESKSWTEKGVDVAAKIALADQLDSRFGLMLRIMLHFGLRRKEVCSTRLWKADKGDKLVIYPGEAKGGRPRDIFIQTAEQRAVLDYVKARIGKGEHLGWLTTASGQAATYKYNVRRYNACMAKIGITKEDAGVTGHGLRGQYSENAAMQESLLPATLGGTGGQMDKEDIDYRRERLSELLGHVRREITNAYYGSYGRNPTPDPAGKRRNNIEAALRYCDEAVTTPILADRFPHCLRLVEHMQAIEVDITPRQAQLLWQIHSQRFGSHWVIPDKGIGEAMEAAAIRLVKHLER